MGCMNPVGEKIILSETCYQTNTAGERNAFGRKMQPERILTSRDIETKK